MKYIIVPLIIITILPLPNLGFSQSSVNSTAGGEKEVRLASPILQKVSDKGTYLVTIKSAQSSLPTGLNIEIVFLNQSSPKLNAPPPNSESNFRGTETNKSIGLVVPSVVEKTLPVKSYDIAITSKDGKQLWNKTNQAPQGGRGPQAIALKDYNVGNVTITIKNIVPDPSVVSALNDQKVNGTQLFAGLGQNSSKSSTDSVKFETSIVVV